ncbi:hypothetical protein [Microbispora sp. GKU 823]|uniref:hypothetical protein n=1 Tax=Microbispora sp. GKU 823 TaxID=1652100 RepID=UPI00211938D9|nr:hypothetical protein [Microbispora sp. GKU 823]
MLLVAVIAVLLLGVPLGVVVVRLISDEVAQELRTDASRLLLGVEYSLSQGQGISPDQLARNYPDRYLQVFVRGKPPIVVGSPPPAGRDLTEEARSENGYVRVSRDAAQIQQDTQARLVLIIALAVVALGAAIGLATVTSLA